MKSLFIVILGLVLITSQNANAKGSKRTTPPTPLKTSIKVTQVGLTNESSMAGTWPSTVACPKFLGTHAGNDITLLIHATGGEGDHHHTVMYRVTKSYKLDGKAEGQIQETRTGDGKIKITLPELDDTVPFVQQTLFLITRDEAGNTASDSITFVVSRPVILAPSQDREIKKKDCFQRYRPEESTVGVLSNGSTNPSTMSIKQGISNVWSSTRGWSWGVFISPLSFLGLGNLLSLNLSYFSQVSKQTVETVELAAGYQLNPGDYMQIYVQPTRYVSAYDATLVSPCGKTEKLPGAYMFQWWGFAYQIYPVNPFEKSRVPLDAVGAPAMNTCPKDLTPFSDNDGSPNDTFQFRKTNQ